MNPMGFKKKRKSVCLTICLNNKVEGNSAKKERKKEEVERKKREGFILSEQKHLLYICLTIAALITCLVSMSSSFK